jgi:RND family efflux transporter MFP subunit
MRHISRQPRCRLHWLAISGALWLSFTAGCQRPAGQEQATQTKKSAEQTVAKPERKTVRRLIEQPGYNIEAFQQTPLYAKLAAFVEKVNVDIGDTVKGPKYDSAGKLIREGDVLAELWLPEMVVEFKQREAAVRQAQAEVLQAKKALSAAEGGLKSAEAQVKQAEAGRLRAQAEVSHNQSQFRRLTQAGKTGTIAGESVTETEYLLEAAKAGLAEVEAKIQSAKALRDESEAKRDKAQADVSVAVARLEVAEAARDQVKTLLGYTKIRAPFDGVVTRRNVDVGHFVQPAAGMGGKGQALFDVYQTDLLRVFVNVPELDAVWVNDKAPAYVRVQGLKGQQFSGTVTRTAFALDPRTRTLRTEIDLPSHGGKLRPGMYVYATIVAEHKDVWALPAGAVVTEGEKSYCFRVENGNAIRTPLQVGLSSTELVEVLKKQTKPMKAGEPPVWEDITGTEQIVTSKPSALSDGQEVTVSQKKDG